MASLYCQVGHFRVGLCCAGDVQRFNNVRRSIYTLSYDTGPQLHPHQMSIAGSTAREFVGQEGSSWSRLETKLRSSM